MEAGQSNRTCPFRSSGSRTRHHALDHGKVRSYRTTEPPKRSARLIEKPRLIQVCFLPGRLFMGRLGPVVRPLKLPRAYALTRESIALES